MRLANLRTPEGFRAVVVISDFVVDAAAAAAHAGWPPADAARCHDSRWLVGQPLAELSLLHEGAVALCVTAGEAVSRLDLTKLGPPIADPSKIVCIGLNYRDHAEEVGAAAPAVPMFFAKFANSLIGPVDDIEPPIDTTQVDYEAELAVVIGRRGRYIDRADASSHVAALTVFNDVSARDLQLVNNLWTGGKAIDTFGPCGPWLVTADEIDDVQSLGLRTRVNGVTVQDGNTADMIFGVAEVVSFLSRIMTLEPGDIIATGTPAGVGKAHGPGTYLRTGDLVEVEVDGVGTLRNTVIEPRTDQREEIV